MNTIPRHCHKFKEHKPHTWFGVNTSLNDEYYCDGTPIEAKPISKLPPNK